MRAGAGSVVFLLLSGINVFWAAGAWVFVPIALFEFWCRGWIDNSRDEWKASIASFVFASTLFVGAFFQAIYAEQVVGASSIPAGLDTIWRQVDSWAHKDPLFGGPLVVVWGAQCLAIACVASLLRQPVIFESGGSVITLELSVVLRRVGFFWKAPVSLVVAAPFVDWVAYWVARMACAVFVDGASWAAEPRLLNDWFFSVIVGILLMAGLCMIPLGIGSVICSACMVFAWWLVDRIELLLWPVSAASREAD